MIIQYTVYAVPVSDKRVFSYRQQHWKNIESAEGLLGRIGGWNIKNPLEACTLTFFHDLDAYESFQEQTSHDPLKLAKTSNRLALIESQIYEKKKDIFGRLNEQVFASMKECGHLLKIGTCQIKKEKRDDFLLMQQSVWNLGMANAPGMTTGLFAESVHDASQFLILTRWKSKGEYQAFAEHVLPKLLNWAYNEQIEEQFQGRLIRLVNEWCFQCSTFTK